MEAGPWAGVLDAGGIPACSRWLSAATPPVAAPQKERILKGCQPRLGTLRMVLGTPRLASLQDAERLMNIGIRWCRCAQPPATRFHPSGMMHTRGHSRRNASKRDIDRRTPHQLPPTRSLPSPSILSKNACPDSACTSRIPPDINSSAVSQSSQAS